MKTMLKKFANVANFHEEDFSKRRVITVVALLITFVGTTVYLMVTCYNS